MPSELPEANPILAIATRSGRVESWHRGAIALVHDGELVWSCGNVTAQVYARSSVKPLQVLPLLEQGGELAAALSPQELALLCASHDGTEAHVAVVRGLLQRHGLHEDQLGCGPHPPFDSQARLALLRSGQKPLRVHNNCSGKHTGFLLLARICGDDLGRYLDPGCRSQQAVNAAVAAMAGLPGPLPVGVDGCGAPTFCLPLAALAQAFCRLANPRGLSDVRAEACRRIVAAAAAAPDLLAGPTRFCTALLRHAAGRLFVKNGAEGVYAIAVAPDPVRRRWPLGIGIAIKVDDGAERGYQPLVVALLRQLGVLSDPLPEALREFAAGSIRNTRGEVVGDVQVAPLWRES